METTPPSVRHHGHHKVAAAIFVGLLVLGASIILAAELTKPSRYQFQSLDNTTDYVIFDTDTGEAVRAKVGSEKPIDAFK